MSRLGTRSSRAIFQALFAPAVAAAVLAGGAAAQAADTASGTITLRKHETRITHVVMVCGPDEMDESHSLLRLYFSPDDIGARIRACKTLSCADQVLGDGASVDFADAPHLGYWVRLDGGRVQNSGGTEPDAFALDTNAPDHLAGKLHLDATAMGGPMVDARFDATLAATFTRLR